VVGAWATSGASLFGAHAAVTSMRPTIVRRMVGSLYKVLGRERRESSTEKWPPRPSALIRRVPDVPVPAPGSDGTTAGRHPILLAYGSTFTRDRSSCRRPFHRSTSEDGATGAARLLGSLVKQEVLSRPRSGGRAAPVVSCSLVPLHSCLTNVRGTDGKRSIRRTGWLPRARRARSNRFHVV
jgi:hypothetical protein